ncbi:MAG: polysulfide reductase NrfD [Firmicutes bacterium]|nr:polysulfide reductase NrfD [Bacillota bacterium]MCL5040360.1 polysulfide reductase NrfD [Bacillota bacterium]
MKSLPKLILGLGVILGLYGFWSFTSQGHTGLGYTSYVPWGLWVVFYTSLVGMSVGAFLVTFLAYGLGISTMKPAARVAPVISLVSLFAGLLFIVLDLGHWERVFNLLFSLNPRSPMAYLGWLYLLYTLLLLFLLGALRGGKEDSLTRLALAGLVISFFVALGEGSLFSVLRARIYWNNGLTLLRYLAGAYMAGVALTLLLASSWKGLQDSLRPLSRLSLGLVLISFFLELIDLGVAFNSGNAHELEAHRMVLFGSGAWLFWLIQLGLGVVLAAALLWNGQKTGRTGTLGLAASAVLLGYLAAKFNLVLPGQQTSLLPGLVEAFSHPKLVLSYAPTSAEVLVVIGLLSLAGLATIYLTEIFTTPGSTSAVKGRVQA